MQSDTQAVKTRQVFAAFGEVEDEIGVLKSVLDSLQARLGPLMSEEPALRSMYRPDWLRIEDEAGKVSSYSVPFAMQLQSLARQIHEVSDTHRGILDRLQV